MEIFTIRNLNFAYPEQEKNAITDLSLSVQPGEFLVLCGPSGCGKSTLLRQLKTVLAPHGRRSGEILFEGRNLDSLDQREQAEKIGVVRQSTENQIVTDKVWHELAFGLESLGYDTPTIRRRVAEMASFFGIQEWFYRPVTELSGGQKQRVAIARALMSSPRMLLLDEPSMGLSPLLVKEIFKIIRQVNRNGVTVLLVEQNAKMALEIANRAYVLETGTIKMEGEATELANNIEVRKAYLGCE